MQDEKPQSGWVKSKQVYMIRGWMIELLKSTDFVQY